MHLTRCDVRAHLYGRHAPAVLSVQDHLRARIDHWLHEHSAKLVQPAPNINSDSEDEEGDGSSYCGRAGCRDYPHEHVSWAKKQPEKRVVPRELKRV